MVLEKECPLLQVEKFYRLEGLKEEKKFLFHQSQDIKNDKKNNKKVLSVFS